ncbi:DUF4189 domain-containing protein [Gordonia sp. (in: high G+C Gram-positive bacteria)]|uniref:DUF4189 domain-containing protein n=1 Tax=Gordonia sp. (in: high G+C Gram-positive bacteria) TaxID=84139 RepID=UPI0016AD2B2E|nr:DUF4189 domain-containing protein [Gordonia sp. (in: high G+C Gram-positive bacteria)]NLG47185.1 DUF4189 domain-containing protein [Gordonia sp. (in: high G+C Gram-positive bacteria)]
MNIRKRLAAAALVAVGFGTALTVPTVVDPAPAAAANYYGALALSPSTGATGRALDYPDWSSASNAALSWCGYTDCKVVVRMRNACGAIAKSNSYWGYGWAANLYTAQSNALYYSGGGYIHDWACTSGHQ